MCPQLHSIPYSGRSLMLHVKFSANRTTRRALQEVPKHSREVTSKTSRMKLVTAMLPRKGRLVVTRAGMMTQFAHISVQRMLQSIAGFSRGAPEALQGNQNRNTGSGGTHVRLNTCKWWEVNMDALR